MKAVLVVVLFMLTLVPAQARPLHHHHYYRHHYTHYAHGRRDWATTPHYSWDWSHDRPSRSAGIIGGRPAGCPSAFCGCAASLHIFGRIIPELNLAANWGRFPSARPGPGMAAYRAHHVFIIESVNEDGTVVAYDGNSGGHLTRIHTVSLHGYRVVDPHGGIGYADRRRRTATSI